MKTDDRMDFMSPEHVSAMNERLRDAEEVRAACRELGEPRVLQFHLANGPDGADVYWTVEYHHTMQFGLEPHPEPDIVLSGDWTNQIRATVSSRTDEPVPQEISIQGDPELYAKLATIVELARPFATFDTRLPDV